MEGAFVSTCSAIVFQNCIRCINLGWKRSRADLFPALAFPFTFESGYRMKSEQALGSIQVNEDTISQCSCVHSFFIPLIYRRSIWS